MADWLHLEKIRFFNCCFSPHTHLAPPPPALTPTSTHSHRHKHTQTLLHGWPILAGPVPLISVSREKGLAWSHVLITRLHAVLDWSASPTQLALWSSTHAMQMQSLEGASVGIVPCEHSPFNSSFIAGIRTRVTSWSQHKQVVLPKLKDYIINWLCGKCSLLQCNAAKNYITLVVFKICF